MADHEERKSTYISLARPLQHTHIQSSSSTTSSTPSYGGGRYYGGGSTSAYSAGGRSPRGISPYPFILGGAALAFFPGLWLYGAYAYPYSHPYNYRNSTSNKNESLPVQCLCQQYSACGCDDNDNSTYLDGLVANATADRNSSLARITNVNGTKTLVINGTLPNGTDNSSSGNSSASGSGTATSAGLRQIVLESSGFWLMGAVVGLTVWAL